MSHFTGKYISGLEYYALLIPAELLLNYCLFDRKKEKKIIKYILKWITIFYIDVELILRYFYNVIRIVKKLILLVALIKDDSHHNYITSRENNVFLTTFPWIIINTFICYEICPEVVYLYVFRKFRSKKWKN